MMQLKNLHGNIAIDRVYDCAWNGHVRISLTFSLLAILLSVLVYVHYNGENE